MRYIFFDVNGRIDSAFEVSDDAIIPANAFILTDQQWFSRFDLLLVNNVITISPPTPPMPPVIPDKKGFSDAIKAGLGGIVNIAQTNLPYAAFFLAIQGEYWQDIQDLIIDAHTRALLTDNRYNTIKVLVTTYHIPITLP